MAARRRAPRPDAVPTGVLAAGSRALVTALLKGIVALEGQSARFCIVGGIARAYLTVPRSTGDIDFAVAVASEDEADRVVFGMQNSGFIVREIFQREDGAMATARLGLDARSSMRVDLLFATSGIEAAVVDGAQTREIVAGVRAPVASLPHLVVMKLIASRPHDLDDVHQLLDVASKSDVAEVERVLRLVQPDRRNAAQRSWRAVLKARARRKPDLVLSPARLRRFTNAKPKSDRERRKR